jgi:hypothetical protein
MKPLWNCQDQLQKENDGTQFFRRFHVIQIYNPKPESILERLIQKFALIDKTFNIHHMPGT